jgi:hypothetical protein
MKNCRIATLLFFVFPSLLMAGLDGVDKQVSRENISKKLKETYLKKVSQKNTDVSFLFEFVAEESVKMDPFFRGVKFEDLTRSDMFPKAKRLTSPVKFNVDYKNIPLDAILEYLTTKEDVTLEVLDGKVVLLPRDESLFPILTRKYLLPPTFFLNLKKAEVDKIGIYNVKEILLQKGIKFGINASAFYDSKSGELTLSNTEKQIDLFERFGCNVQPLKK